MSVFDRKFGASLAEQAPDGPGVYLYRDADGAVIYVGKAKSLKRRLSNYRHASRRKLHRKLRLIVRDATSLELRPLATELDALLLENELIRSLRPRLNVEGAFTFLYPSLGLGRLGRQTLLCFSTQPEAYRDLPLCWHGAFRSRPRTKDAFEALVDLLGRVGHLDPSRHLPPRPQLKGSRLVGFRQIGDDTLAGLTALLTGTGRGVLVDLSVRLLRQHRARSEASAVQAHLLTLAAFFDGELSALRNALHRQGMTGSYIPAAERDSLFIRAKHDLASSAD